MGDYVTASCRDPLVTTAGEDTAPVARDDSYEVKKNKALTVSAPGVTDSDETTGNVTVHVVSSPSKGALTLNANGSFTYKPASGFKGETTFSYRVKDRPGFGAMTRR